MNQKPGNNVRLFLYLYTMEAKKLIYNLREALSGMGSQVSSYTDQYLMYMLDEARATFAAQKMDARVNVSHMAQFVDAKLVTADASELGFIGDSRVLKLDIPRPISYSNGCGIFTVGPTDGDTSYSQISYSQLRTALHRKYTGSSPMWLFFNNEIYLINSDVSGLSKLRARGIFDNPVDVEIFMGRHKKLAPFNFEYPLSMKEEKTIYQLALQSTLGWGDTAAQSVNAANSKQSKDNQLITALKGRASK